MLQRKKSSEFLSKILKTLADCLLGAETHNAPVSEFYGDCEIKILLAVARSVQPNWIVAYLDPFDHLRLDILRPELILKPDHQEQALKMLEELVQTKEIDLVILDSFFWLPAERNSLPDNFRTMQQIIEQHGKPIYLLNPSYHEKRPLGSSLEAFCNVRIKC